jgi:hypothetical protein
VSLALDAAVDFFPVQGNRADYGQKISPCATFMLLVVSVSPVGALNSRGQQPTYLG